MKVMIMQIKIKFFVFISLIILSKLTISGTIINDDLKESLEKLYETNPELSYERELLKSKDELMPQALSEFRPKISGYYKKGKVDTNSQGFNIAQDNLRTETYKGVKLTQPIFDGGSSLSNIKEAKNKIISHRFLLKQKEQDIFLDSIRTYADLATAQTNLFLKKKNLEVLKRRLELTKEQFDIGEVTLTDVSIAEARHLLAQSELIESEKNVNTLSAKFNYIFGVNPNKPNIILDYKQINLEESLIEKSSQKYNPKLNDIKYQIKSIRNEIEKIKRKRLPTVKLEGEAYINEGYFKFDSKREVLSAFATVDIPLYQSGAASSKIRETRSKLLSLQSLLKKIKDEISYNLISSKSLFDNSLSKIAAYEKQIKSNNIYLDGLKQEMQLGERTMLDLLDGEQELLQSELDLALSFKDLFIAYYQTLYHEGKLNAKDLRLSVKHYDVEKNFNKVKGKWLDIIE
ncbi:MAG: hypothetical protein CMM89_01730 [Rickettsiales bacterium]|nr:hypothetical protein [Rickettsiales bacterium]OUT46075.1 MAG: hypothetical protein CBB73_01700 [Pelagibacteraceae bacterium TMED13]|tara:strand:+ start:641 stop:2020 length:1380 start_codon:yes stop_codon:yes gene_type:complete